MEAAARSRSHWRALELSVLSQKLAEQIVCAEMPYSTAEALKGRCFKRRLTSFSGACGTAKAVPFHNFQKQNSISKAKLNFQCQGTIPKAKSFSTSPSQSCPFKTPMHDKLPGSHFIRMKT
jgi:hypothetical protein